MVIPLKNNKNHFDRGPFYILKPAELLPGRYISANYCWLDKNLFDEFRGPQILPIAGSTEEAPGNQDRCLLLPKRTPTTDLLFSLLLQLLLLLYLLH